MDEQLAKQHTTSDEQAASPLKKGVNHILYLSCLFYNLVDVRHSGAVYQGSPKDTVLFQPTVLTLQRTQLAWAFGCLTVLTNSTAALFEMPMPILQSCS